MLFNQILTEEMYKQHQVWLEDHNIGTQLVLTGANLIYANLIYANLSNAVLTGANLYNAALNHVNLFAATITNANLTYADLRRSNLSDADLTDAVLTGADIRFCDPDGTRIKRIALPNYKVNILDNHTIAIGCQQHHLDTWKSFSDYQIDRMDTDALQWWNTHKTTIFNFIEEHNNAI
jgi:hypothetical protein